jgi:hypothetical protein
VQFGPNRKIKPSAYMVKFYVDQTFVDKIPRVSKELLFEALVAFLTSSTTFFP